jgi:hypothetical protein
LCLCEAEQKYKGFCFGALPVLFYEIHELKFDEKEKEKEKPQQQQQQKKFGRCGGPQLLLTSVV